MLRDLWLGEGSLIDWGGGVGFLEVVGSEELYDVV